MSDHSNDDSSRNKVSRRHLLVTTGVGASAMAFVACGGGMGNGDGGTGGDTGSSMVDAGDVTTFAVDTCTFLQASHLIVCRDAGGLYAFTSICTHQGCDVPTPGDTQTATTINCPCHHSVYNANGDILSGQTPTQPSLNHFAVTITNGRVMVDKSNILADRTTRTPVA